MISTAALILSNNTSPVASVSYHTLVLIKHFLELSPQIVIHSLNFSYKVGNISLEVIKEMQNVYKKIHRHRFVEDWGLNKGICAPIVLVVFLLDNPHEHNQGKKHFHLIHINIIPLMITGMWSQIFTTLNEMKVTFIILSFQPL